MGIRFSAKRGGYRVMTMENGVQSKLEIRENKLRNLGCVCHSSDGRLSFIGQWRSKFNPDAEIRSDIQIPLLPLTQ